VLAGDPRLFYLLWLIGVAEGAVEEDAAEPLPGLGPMSGAIEAFTTFFDLDPDLVAAAAERPAVAVSTAASSAAVSKMISAMPDREKTKVLTRLFDGDPHVAAELRAAIRKSLAREIDAPPIIPGPSASYGSVPLRSVSPASTRPPKKPRPNASDVPRRLRKRNRYGSSTLHDAAKALGRRSRPRSSGATHRATTRPRRFCWICARSRINMAGPWSSLAAS